MSLIEQGGQLHVSLSLICFARDVVPIGTYNTDDGGYMSHNVELVAFAPLTGASWSAHDTRTARDRWEPQVEDVMRTAVSFPQLETKVYRTSRSQEAR
jgi:hypothetical protein